MQGIFRKENTDKALKYGIYRHLPTYEKIIRNLVSFSSKIKLIGKYCFDDNLLRKVYLRSNPRIEEGAFPKDAVIQYSKKVKNRGSVAELEYRVKTKKLYVVANLSLIHI